MSDAFTDIARDEKRSGLYRKYIIKAKKFTVDPSKETLEEVIEAARAVDSVGIGYWGWETNIFSKIEKALDELKSRHGDRWEEFLGEITNIPVLKF